MKLCNKCNETKTLDQFYINTAREDGLSGFCKDCQKRIDRERRKAIKEQIENGTFVFAESRRCRGECKEVKGKEDFIVTPGGKGGLSTSCRECRRWENLFRKYGIKKRDYEIMHSNQRGQCAHCVREDFLSVDHCHLTGVVRALLCQVCNMAEGLLPQHTATYECFWRTVKENLELWSKNDSGTGELIG